MKNNKRMIDTTGESDNQMPVDYGKRSFDSSSKRGSISVSTNGVKQPKINKLMDLFNFTVLERSCKKKMKQLEIKENSI